MEIKLVNKLCEIERHSAPHNIRAHHTISEHTAPHHTVSEYGTRRHTGIANELGRVNVACVPVALIMFDDEMRLFLSCLSSTSTPRTFRVLMRLSAATSSPYKSNGEEKHRIRYANLPCSCSSSEVHKT